MTAHEEVRSWLALSAASRLTSVLSTMPLVEMTMRQFGFFWRKSGSSWPMFGDRNGSPRFR